MVRKSIRKLSRWAAIASLPVVISACAQLPGPFGGEQRANREAALSVLSLDLERAIFEPGANVSGGVAAAQKALRVATPSGGDARDKALGPIPTELQFIVRRLVTTGNRVEFTGDLALRDLGLGKIMARKKGVSASGTMPIAALGPAAPGLVFRGLEDEVIAWLSTLECDTDERFCAVPAAPVVADPQDAVTEGADLNLASMVGRRPQGLRRINSSGIDPSQIAAAAPVVEAATIAPPANLTPIGETVAALGLLDRSGLWLQTPLVTKEAKGQIQIKGSSKRIPVTLVPKVGPRGGGSQMSLAAMAELGIELTDLVTLVVYR